MKKLFLFVSLLTGCTYLISAQETITISGEYIKDAYINSVNYAPNGHAPTLIAAHWTYGGYEGVGRSLIRFDLSEIPEYAQVLNAKLSLYHDPTSEHIGHSNMGGDNTGIIMRIVEDWSDEEVTWYTQPITTNTNWAIIPAPESEDQDYPNIDVTELIQDMIDHPDLQQGLMIKLYDEYDLYRSLVFASVDHADPDLRPMLYIEYDNRIEYDTIIHIKPGSLEGKDAYINSVNHSPNGDEPTLIASVWTYYGEEGTGRFLIDFQLAQYLPVGTEILKAEFNLYHDPVSAHIGHSTMGGKNSLIINRITESWDEHTVYWYEQPEISSDDQVIVNSSNIFNQHYLNIDITDIAQAIIDNPEEGHGLLVRLSEETNLYRSVVFASSDHPDSLLWPSIDIYIGLVTNTSIPKPDNFDFLIYPNPSYGCFKLEQKNKIIMGPLDVFIFDEKGMFVQRARMKEKTLAIDLSLLPSGIYYIQIESQVKKVCVIH